MSQSNRTPNRRSLTQLFVDRVKHNPKASITWDTALPGFGLRTAATGRKSWIAVYRVAGSDKVVWQTIGNTYVIPNVAEARSKARSVMEMARSGIHPVEQHKKQKAANDEAAKRAIEHECENVIDRYLAEAPRPKRAGRRGYPEDSEVSRIFRTYVLPAWSGKAIGSLTTRDVRTLIEDKAQSRDRARKGFIGGATIQANRLLATLQKFLRWCVTQGLIASDPSAGVEKPGVERDRERYLDESEILSFWRAAEGLAWPYGPIFRLMLLSLQRESEVAGIRWSEFDDPAAPTLWKIPGERTKSKREHIVHLCPLAAEIIQHLPRVYNKEDLVFPSGTDKTIKSFHKAKLKLDAAMLQISGKPIEHFVLHDLRRTGATVLASLKIPPVVVDKILNHAIGTSDGRLSTVARIYNRFEYVDERREAMETLDRYIETLIRPTQTNVVPFAAVSA